MRDYDKINQPQEESHGAHPPSQAVILAVVSPLEGITTASIPNDDLSWTYVVCPMQPTD